MANWLAGLAKGFADAGNESMKENAKFNRELEQASRIQAMEAHAEKTKIFDQIKTLNPGTEMAMFMAKRAGVNWDNLSDKSKEQYVLETINSHEEILKQFDPGKQPTYDDYQGQLKQDKVVSWLRDKIGITPRHAYSTATAESDIKNIVGMREPMILEEKPEQVTLKQGEAMYERGASGRFDKILENPKQNSSALEVLNFRNKDTGDVVTAYKGSPKAMELVSSGKYVVASKYNLMDVTEIDWDNDSLPARSYLRKWAKANSEVPEGEFTNEERQSLEVQAEVANMILDWSEEEEKGGTDFMDLSIEVIRNYRSDKSGLPMEQKWNRAVIKAASTVKPGTSKWFGIKSGRDTRTFDTNTVYPVTRGVTPRQRVMSQLPQDIQDGIESKIYNLRYKDGNYVVLDNNGKYITGGSINENR